MSEDDRHEDDHGERPAPQVRDDDIPDPERSRIAGPLLLLFGLALGAVLFWAGSEVLPPLLANQEAQPRRRFAFPLACPPVQFTNKTSS